MLAEGQEQVIDESGDVLTPLFEHFRDRFLRQFLRWNGYAQADRQPTEVHAQVVESRIHRSGTHRGDPHAERIQFVRQCDGEGTEIGFGGFIDGDAREHHPCGKGGHVQDISMLLPLHIFSEETAQLGDGHDMKLQHHVDAPHIRVRETIEEEYTRIVHQDLHLLPSRSAHPVQLLRGLAPRQVHTNRLHTHMVGLRDLPRHLAKLLFLIAHDDQIVASPRQFEGILRPNARTGPCN